MSPATRDQALALSDGYIFTLRSLFCPFFQSVSPLVLCASCVLCSDFSLSHRSWYAPHVLVSRGGYRRPNLRWPLAPLCRVSNLLAHVSSPSMCSPLQCSHNSTAERLSLDCSERVTLSSCGVERGVKHCQHRPLASLCAPSRLTDTQTGEKVISPSRPAQPHPVSRQSVGLRSILKILLFEGDCTPPLPSLRPKARPTGI